ncbi:unnamed protein product [Caenorhabditis brenneri]
MIGICLSDILGFLVLVTNIGMDRHWYEENMNELRMTDFKFMLCLVTGYKVLSPIGTLKVLIIQSTRPISIWLAILMALIRSLSIIFPLNDRINNLSKPGRAVLMMLVTGVFWIIYYSWELVFAKLWWFPDHIGEGCYSPRKALAHSEYVIVLSWEHFYFSEFREAHEYLVRIIPALFYPVLTVSLIIQLWRIRKNRKVNSLKSDNTTALILFMTLSFMLSEGLAGISNFIEHSLWMDYEWTSYAGSFSEVFNNLRSFNALSHFFVCVLMSSQYRDTVKRMFCGCKSRKEKVIQVQEAYSKQSQSFNRIHSRSF